MWPWSKAGCDSDSVALAYSNHSDRSMHKPTSGQTIVSHGNLHGLSFFIVTRNGFLDETS